MALLRATKSAKVTNQHHTPIKATIANVMNKPQRGARNLSFYPHYFRHRLIVSLVS